MGSPLAPEYIKVIERDGYHLDRAQHAALLRLQQLRDELVRDRARNTRTWRAWFSGGRSAEPINGVYLWGGVGRGKTYLMDLFYESLPLPNKMRTHFHRFMRRVHRELSALEGTKNPLQKVAERFASEARLICFDEMFVSDITDAMILANLLQALFERGVVLVATSNIVPDGLYRDGLQRVRFLPAIALLKQHLDVLNVDGGTDYRLRALTQAETYYAPHSAQTELELDACFLRLAPETKNAVSAHEKIEIEGRSIAVRREADGVVWFDFAAICDGPRSQHDYIQLAQEYHTVLISGVPEFARRNDDQARRFINLVDEFYDRRVKLVLSAATPATDLYTQGALEFEFQRTVSRLLEMQSQEYLALEHRP